MPWNLEVVARLPKEKNLNKKKLKKIFSGWSLEASLSTSKIFLNASADFSDFLHYFGGVSLDICKHTHIRARAHTHTHTHTRTHKHTHASKHGCVCVCVYTT
jgi:hypothetical protein